MAAAWDRVVELARAERDAVARGDWAEVSRLQDDHAALRAELEGMPAPATSLPDLLEAVRLNNDVQAALRMAMAGIEAELVGLGHSRTAAAGYRAAGLPGDAGRNAWEG